MLKYKVRFYISLVVVFTMVILSNIQYVNASDKYLDQFKKIDQSLNGKGYSQYTDGSYLGWSEAYFLDSYLEQYKKTKDNYWLDKFVEHTDTVISNASDFDNDGKLGWNALGYSYQHFNGSTYNNNFNKPGAGYSNPNLITTGSMETVDTGDPTMPIGWLRENADSSKIYRSTVTGEKYSGIAGLVVKSDGSSNVAAKTRVTGLKLNKEYELSFFAKTDSTRTVAYCLLYDATRSSLLGGSPIVYNNKWDRYYATMISPVNETDEVYIKIYFADPSVNNMTVYLDDVSLKEVKYESPESGGSLILNGGMETANPIDSTLPDKWTRIGSSTTVYRSNTVQEYFTDSYGAVVKSDGANPQILEQKISYVPGQRYTVSLRARTNSSSAVGMADIYNYTNSSSLASQSFCSYAWVNQSFTFDAPDVPGKDVRLRLRLSSDTQASWIAYFDNVMCLPTGTGLGLMNYVRNDSFEEADSTDSTLPNGWTRLSGTSSAEAYRSNGVGDSKSGLYGLVIKNTNSGYKTLEQQFTYIPGRKYNVSFDYKCTDINYSAWFYVYDLTTSQYIITRTAANTNWTTSSYSFTAPSAEGHNLRIRLSLNPSSGTTAKVYFDNIKINLTGDIDYYVDIYNRIPSLKSVLLNGTAMTLDPDDSTLPLFWHRENSDSSTVYASNTIREYSPYQAAIEKAVYGMVIKSNGVSYQMLKQQFPFDPGARYTVQFSARLNTPQAGGLVEVVDQSGNVLGSKTVTSARTAWGKYYFTFTAPSDISTKIYIRLKQSSANHTDWVVCYDDISVAPVYTGSIMGYQLHTLNERMAYISSDITNSYDNTPYLVIQNDGSTAGYAERTLYGYDTSAPYVVTFNAKTNSPSTKAYVQVYDFTAGISLASYSFNNDEWAGWKDGFPNEVRHEVRFTTPSDGSHNIRVILLLWNLDSSMKVYFDNIDVSRSAEYLVHEALLANKMLDFAIIVNGDSNLSAYSTKATTYKNFVTDNIYPKYESYYRTVSPTEGVYVAPSDLSFGSIAGRTLPYNQYTSLAVTAIKLYKLTGDSSYRDRAEKLFNTLKNRLTVVDDKYTWYYWEPILPVDAGYYTWPAMSSRSEDVGHAGLTLSNMLEAYNAGIVFSKSDFDKIINTFKNVTWNGSYTLPVIKECLFGEGYTNETLRWQNSIVEWGFTRLAQFDKSFWDISKAVWDVSFSRSGTGLASLLSLWDRSKVTNGDMELIDPNDNTIPATWSRDATSSSSTVYRDMTQKYCGDAGLTVVSNGPDSEFYEGGSQQLENYVPNSKYTLKFAGKVQASGITDGYVEVLDNTAFPATVLASQSFSNNEWQEYTLDFTTPSITGHRIVVKFRHEGHVAGNHVYFDNFRVLPYLYNSETINSSFEDADEWDNTLPLYWSRGTNSTASTVFMDSNEKYRGEKSIKIITAPSSGSQELKFQLMGFKAGATYKLDFYSKTNASSAGGKAYIKNETSGATLATQTITSSSWTNYQVTFTAPINDLDTVMLYLTHNDPSQSGGNIWFDEVGVLQQ